jgi:two-component system, OmpR family, sensor histidine kinase ChvG
MNLRRQLLLVSLLTLVLPWAGCQFIRETESALREGQQRMLAGTAQAIADSLAQFPREFLVNGEAARYSGDELYAHALPSAPLVDGYFDDWALPDHSLAALAGGESVRYALGTFRQNLFLYVDVQDDDVLFALPGADETLHSDRVQVVTTGENREQRFVFAPEAPGALVPLRRSPGEAAAEETRIAAQWQATAGGYRLEARVPQQLLGPAVGLIVIDTDSVGSAGEHLASFAEPLPGRLVTPSPLLQSVAMGYTQPGLRLIVTDKTGWRLAEAGSLSAGDADGRGADASGWMRLAYNLLLEPGDAPELAQPDASGREQLPYIRQALDGEPATSWFRSLDSGRAVVAVAQPVWSGTVQTGAVVLQQGTEAILSLTNEALSRLMSFTLIATLVVAAALLGYASWLSLRIRRLSGAALHALDRDEIRADLPSRDARDEIGDLSRSFSRVLSQLGEYNAYLRSLASKLSHEMRTPLTIVKSSLENLEHEPLSEEGARYTARAREGTERLQKILSAMSEASRVEELIEHAEPETFDLRGTLEAAVSAYAGAWPERRFRFDASLSEAAFHGSPELIVQMLDKLVDNAVGFSREGDEIAVALFGADAHYVIRVTNPGPPLPERMRAQLFDSMVSVRPETSGKHLGLGLFVARLIAVGHGGTIEGLNVDGGVTFEVQLPGRG